MLNQPFLVVFAGPNGSGKSNLIKSYLKQGSLPALYINADDLTRELLAGVSFSQATEIQLEQANILAAKQADHLRLEALNQKISFTIETVLSTPDKINFMRKAKQRGYYIHLEYMATPDPAVNVGRVHDRLQKGGHPVPAEKIVFRHVKASSLLPQVLQIADQASVYDNSLQKPVLLLEKQANQEIEVAPLNKRQQFPARVLDALEKIKEQTVAIEKIFKAIERAGEIQALAKNSSLQAIYNAYAKNALKRGKPFNSYEVLEERGLMMSTDAHICLKLLKEGYPPEKVKNILQKSPVLVGQPDSLKAVKFLLSAFTKAN